VKNSVSKPDVRPGPQIGQDNDYVFKELLGIDDARYRKLIDDEVIF